MHKFYQRSILIVLIWLLMPGMIAAQQWSIQAGASAVGVKGVCRVSEDVFIANGDGALLRSEDGGNNWVTASIDKKGYQTYITPSFVSTTTGYSASYINTVNANNFVEVKPVLLRTTDAGRTWSATSTTGLTKLAVPEFIHFLNINDGILAGTTADGNIIIYRTSNGGLSWAEKFAPADLFSVLDGQFVGTTGYLVTWANVLKTIDGGETWSVQTPGVVLENYETIQRLSFSSKNYGWITGQGCVFRTVNGGEEWIRVSTTGFDQSHTILGVHFFDAARGFLSTSSGTLKYTTDSGASWETRETGVSVASLDFVNERVGFITGPYPDNISRTEDGGITWENTIAIPTVPHSLFDITFNGANKGWAVGGWGLIMHTADGGKHWSEISNPAYDMGFDLYAIGIQNEQTIWAAGMDNTMIKSTDEGQTWALYESLPLFYYSFRDFHFMKSSNSGWVVGDYFKIMKYDGTSWSNHPRSGEKFRSLNSVFFVNELVGWIVGEEGTILKTTDGGQTWNDVASGVLRTFNDVYFVDENIGWVVGENDYILKTEDGGLNWHQQNLPHAFVGNMTGVHFSSPHRGWVVGSDENRGAVYSTTDGGNEWKRILPYFGDAMQGLYFYDLNSGWVITGDAHGDAGAIYHYVGNDTGESDASPPIRTIDFEALTDTLYNFNFQQHALKDSTKFGGMFIGRNGTGIEEFAEKYFIEGEAWVTGIISYHSGTVANDRNIAEFNVFNVDEKGMPDRKLRRKDVYFGDIDLSKTAMVTTFDKPVAVRDSFFVSFNLTDYSHGGFEGDVLGVLHTSNKTRPLTDPATRNTIRIHDHYDRAWRAARDLNTTKGYSGYLALFPIIKYKLSSDATLKSLTATSGTFLPLFTSSVFTYTVHLPYGTTKVPELTFKTSHSLATATYTPAQTLTGNVDERTASIVVRAADGTTNTYSVIYEVAADGLDTLKNHLSAAEIQVMKYNKAQGWGYILGHNYMFRQQYAEKYYIEGEAKVTGVITHLKGRYAHADTLAEFNVFNVSDRHMPGDRLGGKRVPYQNLRLNGDPTTILFDQPITVADSFYVSFNLFDYAHGGYEGDTIGMYMSKPGSRHVSDFAVKGRNVVQRHNHEFTDWIDFRTQNFTPYAVHFALYPIVKFSEDIPTAIGEQYVERSGIRLFPAYPNPVNTRLNLNYSVSRPEDVSVEILDAKGLPVMHLNLGFKREGLHHDSIDVSLLKPGTYIYVLRTRVSSLASKIIVVH